MNCTIWLIAVLFSVLETAYFGQHMFPSCPEELICDGLVAVMLCIAVKNK